MNHRIQGALVTTIGGVAVYLTVSGRFRDYLKPGMRFPLLAAGLTMLVLGALTLARTVSRPGGRKPAPAASPGSADVGVHPEPPHAGGHDHGAHVDHSDHGGPSVAWLLALPILALVLVRPPALGADAARRDSSARLPAPVEREYDPLPAPRDGAVDLTLTEFMTRAYWDDQDSLARVPVRLTGFVVSDPETPDRYNLTRFRMSCCAADAFPIQITVRGLDGPLPADDTWVQVVGEWIPPSNPDAYGAARGAEIALTAQTPIPAPAIPYE